MKTTLLLFFATTLTAFSQNLYAFGNFAGQPGGTGNADGTGSAARWNYPSGLATDGMGNIYVADTENHTIRRISLGGVVTTIAGSPGQSGSADGTNGVARFNAPTGIAEDAAENLYVADYGNSTIRKLSPSGINWVVTTLAGTALQTGSANGTGSSALFSDPFGVAVDANGNVYVADTSNHTIRKITPGAVVTTLAGGVGVSGVANGNGTNATFSYPHGVSVDSLGNIYVADTGNNAIRKITPGGDVTTIASGQYIYNFNNSGNEIFYGYSSPYGVFVDHAGNYYVADTGNGYVSEDGGSIIQSGLSQPTGVTLDNKGNIYFTDTDNQVIRKIAATRSISTTLSGSEQQSGSQNGVGNAALFFNPQALAVDTTNNVYVADTYNNLIREISPAGSTTTLAGSGYTGNANGTGTSASFFYPGGVAVDTVGNVYVADTYNNTIRGITQAGVVTTIAGNPGQIGSADGVGSTASFYFPSSIAVDNAFNLYVADTYNHTIRKITAGGTVTTIAGSAGYYGSVDGTGSTARFWAPSGVAVDASGNVYVADMFNDTIRQISPAGVVTTLAGSAGQAGSADGTGSAARFDEPGDVAVDSLGNIYVADTSNQTIRRITPALVNGSTNWVVTTIGGTVGVIGGGLLDGLDGIGPAAEFDFPMGVAVDLTGNVYVADTGNNRISIDSILENSVTGPSFGTPSVVGGLFQFPVINAAPGYSVVVQESSNLTTWVPILTNTAAVFEVSRPVANQESCHFFRAFQVQE